MAATAAPAPQRTSLYVCDLPRNLEEAEATLYRVFSNVGPIVSTKACRDMHSHRLLGHAYVNFQNQADAEKAIKQLNFSEITPGNEIRVMWSQRDPATRKAGAGNLFVNHLDDSVSGKVLHDAFAAIGPITSCKVSRDTESGKSRHYGFVQFETPAIAEQAVKLANEDKLLVAGKPVNVESFKKRAERQQEQLQSFTNIYLKNLKKSATAEEVSAALAEFGAPTTPPFLTVQTQFDAQYALVTMPSHEAAVKAIEELNGKEHPLAAEGQTLYVARAQSKAERSAAKAQNAQQPLLQNQGRNLYVKHLPDTMTEETLKELFGKFGPISSVSIARDNATKTARGFGFIVFETKESAQEAARVMDKFMIEGRPLYVTVAQNKDARIQMLVQRAHTQRATAFAPPPMGGAFFGGWPGYAMPGRGPAPMQRFSPAMGPNMPPMGMPQMGYPRGPNMGGRPNMQMGMPGMPPGMMRQGMQGMYGGFPMMPGPMMGGPMMHPGMQGRPQRPHPQAQVRPTTGSDIAAELSKMTPEEQKNMLGERLFVKVSQMNGPQAAKITGMLLEMDTNEIINILEDTNTLQAKVSEAVAVLRDYNQSA